MGKNEAGKVDQEGKLKLPYVLSLYTQCSIYSPVLKKLFSPFCTANQLLYHYF